MAKELRTHENESRAARILRPNESEGAITERMASFRPPEEVALRQDTLETFARMMAEEARLIRDHESTRRNKAFSELLAREALGQFDRIEAKQGRFAKDFGADREFWELCRRVLLAHGDDSRDVVEHIASEAGLVEGLDAIRLAWVDGESPESLLQRLDEVTGARPLEDMPALSAQFATLLCVDFLLELGRSDEAIRALNTLRHHPELDGQTRAQLVAMEASWLASHARIDEASNVLKDSLSHTIAGDDVEDLLYSLLRDTGAKDEGFEFLSEARLSRRVAPIALELSQMTYQRDPKTAAEVLERAGQDFEEDALVREGYVALLHATDAQDAKLIDLLNARLANPGLSSDERVWTLWELGRLYESQSHHRPDAGLESAAAEVYVEALQHEPSFTPAIRALGRLYSRLGEWGLLADLYETEIAHLGEAPFVWRRHFQVAEIYEQRLNQASKALKHYLTVVRHRNGYLPALKGAARLMEREGRWTELADLFLASVSATESRRQKLYLLEKVAEIAEDRLQHTEVAIGAWEEILELDPEQSRAFAALGRLYSRGERWNDLLMLNERELGLIDDEEESAALLVRNASIAVDKLGMTDVAEDAYRRALNLLPDYLPALEGLGRIYVRGARWDELVAMTEAQLVSSPDKREAERHLGALAELMEFECGHEADAVLLYTRIQELNPSNPHVFFALARLHRQTGNWRALISVLEERVVRTLPEDQPILLAEIANVLEWRLESPAEAYGYWMKGARIEAENIHWLYGILRTWRAAGVDAMKLSKELEELALRTMPAEARDTYFLSIARIRERASGTPQKSVGYRVHGDEHCTENQAVVRLCAGLAGDRAGLLRQRDEHPWFGVEQVVGVKEWNGPTKQTLIRVLESASADERNWFVGWLPNELAEAWIEDGDSKVSRLRREIQRVKAGLKPEGDSVDPDVLRLRIEEASAHKDVEKWISLTREEIAAAVSRDLRVKRSVDLAAVLQGLESREVLEEAVEIAFGNEPAIEDGPIVDELFAALETGQIWDAMRTALESHVANIELGDARRAELFEKLGEVLEEKILDLDGARHAYEHAWQLSNDPRNLSAIVGVCRSLDDLESAAQFQELHFREVLKSDSPIDRLNSGLDLAELCVRIGDAAKAIEHLEMLLHPKVSHPSYTQVRLKLAHLHCDFGDVERGIGLFEETLSFNALESQILDWRRLVRAYKVDLGDAAQAYALQWKLVRSQPSSLDDVDELLEIAWELNELHDCCIEIESFAKELDVPTRIALVGRAAVALDEDLGRADEAARLYRDLVAIGGPESTLDYRRRLAFTLSRSVGRETEALKHFETLVAEEPFESTTYKGMVEVFEKIQAYDRARVARQFLRTLNMKVEGEEIRAKSSVSRAFSDDDIRQLLLPEDLRPYFAALHAVMPIAEKLWGGDLPQKKALDAQKIEDSRLLDALANAGQMFGIKKIKAFASDSAQNTPFVFHESTPVSWFNSELIEKCSEPELRFLAGYSAALAWSEVSALSALDGREIWHLLEGILYKQTGAGFSERVDARSQEMADAVSSPFFAVARRRVVQALEPALETIASAHCEAWPAQLHSFALRVGLLSASDIQAATSGTLRMSGWSEPLSEEATQKQLRRSKDVENLFKFGMSEAFLLARFKVGLGSRPSQFNRI
ncbi:tetratricopeptide repeat protein [Microvenator marinus]|uniref:Tetratricopeptide repeat protein n=1 Tax=Microvenator marinus TaxID=2600177 RepID=A0A5B8XKS6_9DELT|nr:tetratricopeptide repeat protein [Microvenator marinus]QED26195.1 tetratricopeptide repeat protein [Microvenator marinus]